MTGPDQHFKRGARKLSSICYTSKMKLNGYSGAQCNTECLEPEPDQPWSAILLKAWAEYYTGIPKGREWRPRVRWRSAVVSQTLRRIGYSLPTSLLKKIRRLVPLFGGPGWLPRNLWSLHFSLVKQKTAHHLVCLCAPTRFTGVLWVRRPNYNQAS